LIASKMHADRRGYVAQHGGRDPKIAPIIEFLIDNNQDEAGYRCA
jgi:hypothetical protein